MGTDRNSQEKDRTAATTKKASKEEEQILKQVNKHKLTTEFTGGNTKLFAKNWKKLMSDKYILDIVKNRKNFQKIDNINSEH